METLALVFVMDASEVKASFKVFYWLSVTDKSNTSTCIFQFSVLCKMKIFFLPLESKIIVSEDGKVENVFLHFTKFIHYKKEWKDGNMLSWYKVFWFN